MPDRPNIGYLLNQPPEKIIAWFQDKGYAISWSWRDVQKEMHSRAFTVAKAMNNDVLSTIRGEVESSLENGTTLRQFRKELEPKLKTLGWWGRQESVNPKTGEVKEVQLGSPWRLKTIYRTNMQTSYMRGRYQHQIKATDRRPWWMYDAVNDSKTRPTHAAHDNQVRRFDDPFWDTYYPPNGWGCRCVVRTLSDRQIEARNITPTQGLPKTPFASEGWDYNPGKTAYFDPNHALSDCDIANSFASGCLPPRDNRTFKDYGRPDARDVPASDRIKAPELLDAAENAGDARDMIASALGVSKKNRFNEIETPVSKEIIDFEKLYHLGEKRQHARERYANFIKPTLESPYEIYLKEYEDGPRRRYIGLFEGVKNNLLVIVRVNKDGSLLYNTMQASDKHINRHRRGDLIYGK